MVKDVAVVAVRKLTTMMRLLMFLLLVTTGGVGNDALGVALTLE